MNERAAFQRALPGGAGGLAVRCERGGERLRGPQRQGGRRLRRRRFAQPGWQGGGGCLRRGCVRAASHARRPRVGAAQDGFASVPMRRRRHEHRRHGACDNGVPAVGMRRLSGGDAGDIEPLLGPRHRHIKQAAVFVVARRVARRAGLGDGNAVVVFFRRPGDQRRFAKRVEAAFLARGGHGAGVRQKHDFRLKALRPMHGHDTHRAARRLKIALDLNISLAQRREEAAQRRRIAFLPGEGEGEKLVERVLRLRAKPRQQPSPPAAWAEER